MPGEGITYRKLWAGALHLLNVARREEPGATWQLVGATLMVWFALEGFANDVGEAVAPEVWADERQKFCSHSEYTGTLGKLRFLADLAHHDPEKGKRPYQTLTRLEWVRDALVHPRTERASPSEVVGRTRRPRIPESPAIAAIESPEFIGHVVKDVAAVCDDIMRALWHEYPVELKMRGDAAFDGNIGWAFDWG